MSDGEVSGTVSVFRRLCIGVACALVVLALGEVLARTLNARRRVRVLEDLGFESEAELVTMGAPAPLYYVLKPDFPGVTNGDGYCGPALSIEKPEGVFRVVVIGDSVSMHGPMEELYHEIVRKRLELEFPGRIEFLNFAVTGYNPLQESIRLREDALAYDPDLVLWQFHDNDGAHAVYDSADAGMARFYNRPPSALLDALRWNSLRLRRRLFLRGLDTEALGRDLSRMLFAWEEVRDVLTGVCDDMRERGIELVFLLYPNWPEEDDWRNYPERGIELHGELRKLLEEREATVLDLLPVFYRLDPAAHRLLSWDPWHPNAKGHRIIAEHLYPVLRKALRAGLSQSVVKSGVK